MLINWFTVIAQLVNFLILVLLLKRYLYKPILKAIDEREKKIADKITQAEKQDAEAVKEHETFRKKNEEFDHQRTSLLAKATEEAKSSGEELKEKAKTEAEDLKTKLEKTFEEERSRLSQEIVSKTRKEVFSISGKVLKALKRRLYKNSLAVCKNSALMKKRNCSKHLATPPIKSLLKLHLTWLHPRRI
jgi:F-type H+-transporting ATPase subunit b